MNLMTKPSTINTIRASLEVQKLLHGRRTVLTPKDHHDRSPSEDHPGWSSDSSIRSSKSRTRWPSKRVDTSSDAVWPKPTELACKIIDQSKSKDEQFLHKFLPRELEILGQIRHPNIIQTHSIMRRNNRVFIFLQLAERGDLLTFIRKHGALPENRTRFWFYQMADAVRYLHRQDIAHRDLKCENILISANMNVKLSDFGFARTCTDPSSGTAIMSKTFCGSAAYAAPEIISTTPYNPKMADLWSLGVVLFIMLNGTMPFDEKNLKKLLRNQLGRHIQFRPEVEKVCSLEAIRMVRSLLEPDPIDRINIEEVMEEPWRASAIANKN
ncbi:hypothetical protein quinque_015887 [Culex quinquefasciatus]